MRRGLITLLCGAAFQFALPSAGAAEGTAAWRFDRGPDGFAGAAVVARRAGPDGSGCLRIENGDEDWVSAVRVLDDPAHDVARFSCKIRPAGARTITVRFVDDTGQCFQSRYPLIDGEWQDLAITDFASGESWGGAGDRTWHGPCERVEIILEARRAACLVDDVAIDFREEEAPAWRGRRDALAGARAMEIATFDEGTDGFDGELARRTDGPGVGEGYARLTNTDQDYVEMSRSLELSHDFLEVRFLARAETAGQIAVRLTDATGQEFLHRVPLPKDGEWHPLVIRRFGEAESWGGAADKRWHPPCKGISFVLEQKKSWVDVDAVRAWMSGEMIARDFVWRPARPSNVFLAGEELLLPFESSAEVVACRVTDFWGREVRACEVRPENGTGEFRPPPQNGYFLVRAEARKGGEMIAERHTSYAVIPPYSVKDPASAPWGVATHFAQGMDPGIIPTLKKAGIAMIRDELYWDEVETQPKQYKFVDRYVRFMDAARGAGVVPLIIMSYANKLYDSGQTPWTDQGCDAFGDYGRAIIERFGPQIRWLEVWNEYNGTWCEGPASRDRPKSYAKLLRRAHAKIKGMDPRVQVLGGAAVLMPLPYLEGIFENGGLDYMDGLVIHPYRARPEGVDDEVEALRASMRAHGGEKDIWVTETGLDTREEHDWEKGRHLYERGRTVTARYLPRQYTLLLKAGCKRIFWYLCSDHQDFVAMGLLRAGGDPAGTGPYVVAPNYVAYATLIRQLDGKAFVRRDGFKEYSRAHCHMFSDGTNEVRVCWATQPASLDLHAEASLKVVDLVGGERPLVPRDGKARLELGEDVQYVVGHVSRVEEPSGDQRVIASSPEDFSSEQGKKHWRYGFREGLGGDFREMTWRKTEWDYRWAVEGRPFAHQSRDGGEPEGNAAAPIYMDRRWTSPLAGDVVLAGQFGSDDKRGDGHDIHVLVDGKEVFAKTTGGGESLSFSVPASLRAGSTVDFLVGPNRDTVYDACSFDLRVIQKSE